MLNDISLLIQIFCIYTLGYLAIARVHKVSELRHKILNEIADISMRECEMNIDWRWRYIEFNKVSYDKMCFMFWLPVEIECFYKNTDFFTKR